MPETEDTGSEKPDSKKESTHAPGAASSAEELDAHHGQVGVEKEAINVGLVLGVVLGTVVIVTVLVSFAFTMTEVTSQQTRELLVAQMNYPDLREVRAAAANRLTRYGVVNAETGTYQIPIDRAINLIVNEQYQDREGKIYSGELILLPAR